MNWVDIVLFVLLLAMVIVGSKKGLVRELMAFLVFLIAIVVSVNYIDRFAVWVYEKVGGSPLVAAFLSFAVLIALSYAAFKLMGMVFYKVANIKSIGKKDQMGGALIGFLRGWLLVGFVTLLLFLLPMPASFYTAFEQSFFGPMVAKTVPLVFEGTAPVHPRNRTFIAKIETALLTAQTSNKKTTDAQRSEVYEVLHQMRRFFATSDPAQP
ncbi:MAG TPA: CvpA family protein [candidate division Zixibacteria bacterium]|nr:CvpA family protein [candidate division Zixibacteria bacterium]MDD4918955.1 CvpA family protein [candidate division Zixibacteria bacterium]MDM7973846.1 CvpA family protein [candidate division Zixibacteria bacterium]HOD66396.1 CvpA family protein [candidate division Zixibacteria bacterium]HPM36034.1 CvpA family protein [candidate division Zixibacteria bacterium]